MISYNVGSWATISDECSTPEGIETVISLADHKDLTCCFVLNARRHRDGDQEHVVEHLDPGAIECSTPEGIETVIRKQSARSW